jgi:hypothetical protein
MIESNPVRELKQRDLIALVALHALLTCAGKSCMWDEVTNASYHIADEMLKAKNHDTNLR